MNYDDDILKAAATVEATDGTEGVMVLPATKRNAVTLQLAARAVSRDLAEAGFEELDAQVVTDLAGRALIYLIDTRDWPEQAEHKFLTILGVAKVGVVPNLVSKLDLPMLTRRGKK